MLRSAFLLTLTENPTVTAPAPPPQGAPIATTGWIITTAADATADGTLPFARARSA